MKEIINSIEDAKNQIKSSSDHSFGVFSICIVCIVGVGYLSDIKNELHINNTLLKTVIMNQKDTVNVRTFKPIIGVGSK